MIVLFALALWMGSVSPESSQSTPPLSYEGQFAVYARAAFESPTTHGTSTAYLLDGYKSHRGFILSQLRSPDAERAWTAAFLLGRAGDTRSGKDLLWSASHSHVFFVQLEAIISLGLLRYRPALPFMKSEIAKPYSGGTHEVVDALYRIDQVYALRAFKQRLSGPDDGTQNRRCQSVVSMLQYIVKSHSSTARAFVLREVKRRKADCPKNRQFNQIYQNFAGKAR